MNPDPVRIPVNAPPPPPLQAPWDGTDHHSPAHHMFNESDPILGPSALEAGFLEEEDEEAQGGGGEAGGTLEECLGLPPSSSPSHPSAGDPVEPLSSSYMLFKVGRTSSYIYVYIYICIYTRAVSVNALIYAINLAAINALTYFNATMYI